MSPIRTVIIDDDLAVAGVHHGFLMAHGAFEVIGTAHTGAAGLQMVKTLRPDLLLLDIHLPDLSGLEVLSQLRAGALGSQLDVFAITAARELSTVRRALAGGVIEYLVKPFGSAEFRARLDRYVAHRSALLKLHTADRGLNQQSIDSLRSTVLPAPEAHGGGPSNAARGIVMETQQPPKGLSKNTLDAVTELLRVPGADYSAAELATELGLARVSARRYLEYLVTQSRATLTPKYGSAGRPENRYSWNPGTY
ncbi:response regulator [Arthrobacter sp. MYb227]|uniref:response regulator n=1 Tax=Arthrobacter sp. MYb227 TaxID=1848601 RepID=UPI000CFDE1E5|nr:response regulator [Arthrobacter sp. MYb227]PQZ92950.1 response regulator [Arthrobacter sp. MYb227]